VDKPWDRDELPDLPHPSQAEFRAGRRRRYGQTNPEPIQDPFLEYMVKTRAEPFFLREEYGHKWTQNAKNGENDKTAVWSFCRIGQTTTLYKNRYRIHIGGEHDDFYDPDFLIYNDVLVEDCADKVWIYGYPREVFPPTDFHTATLLEEDDQQVPSDMRNGILIVGGIGYANDRACRNYWRCPWLDSWASSGALARREPPHYGR